MTHFGYERFAVAGHDRGARVTHRLALDYPDRVLAACVMDIAPTRPSIHAHAAAAGGLGIDQHPACSALSAQQGQVPAMQMEQWLPLEQGADFINFVSLRLMSVVAALGVTLPGVPAVLMPLDYLWWLAVGELGQ